MYCEWRKYPSRVMYIFQVRITTAAFAFWIYLNVEAVWRSFSGYSDKNRQNMTRFRPAAVLKVVPQKRLKQKRIFNSYNKAPDAQSLNIHKHISRVIDSQMPMGFARLFLSSYRQQLIDAATSPTRYLFKTYAPWQCHVTSTQQC